MQGSNHSKTRHPVPKDGTQEKHTEHQSDANWFGTSQEPQEEFIEGDPRPEEVKRGHDPKTSEGKPSFEGRLSRGGL